MGVGGRGAAGRSESAIVRNRPIGAEASRGVNRSSGLMPTEESSVLSRLALGLGASCRVGVSGEADTASEGEKSESEKVSRSGVGPEGVVGVGEGNGGGLRRNGSDELESCIVELDLCCEKADFVWNLEYFSRCQDNFNRF